MAQRLTDDCVSQWVKNGNKEMEVSHIKETLSKFMGDIENCIC